MSARGEGEGKTALITGASAGIGWHLAREFAQHGFALVLVARTVAKLEALATEISNEFGVDALVLPKDLTDPGAPPALFDELDRRGVPVDVLVNDAGSMQFGRFQDASLEEVLALVDLNNRALLTMTRLFVEPMIRGGGGRVLNVASVAAFQPMPSMAVYGATKAFTLSLGEALSEELRDAGVRVTTLCPGFTDTDMIDSVDGARELAARMPAGAVLPPERVAREGYRACMDGVPVHVPGISNQLAVRLIGLQPRWLARALGGFIGRKVL
jgi:short-subunit dehydrogenase